MIQQQVQLQLQIEARNLEQRLRVWLKEKQRMKLRETERRFWKSKGSSIKWICTRERVYILYKPNWLASKTDICMLVSLDRN